METDPNLFDFILGIVALPLQLYKLVIYSVLDFIAFNIFNLPH